MSFLCMQSKVQPVALVIAMWTAVVVSQTMRIVQRLGWPLL